MILAVRYDHRSELTGIFYCVAHYNGIHDPSAVVGKSYGPGGMHLAHLGQLFPLEPFCHCAHWEHVGSSAFFCLGGYILDNGVVIGNGVRIGHAGHGRESSGRGSPGAGLYGLFVRPAGFSEVHVHIYKTREHGLACNIQLFA